MDDFVDFLWSLESLLGQPQTLQRTTDLVIDGVAIAALGSKEPGPQILTKLARRHSIAAVSTILGGRDRVSGPEAARINGVAMHVLDYEPMWNPANHCLSTTLPALLALVQMIAHEHRRGSRISPPDGRTILSALALGIEVQLRIRSASGQYEPGLLLFHPPGAVGSFGSAAACGMVLGLDRQQMRHALGIAASRACGVQANIGSMTKALHCGEAAMSGLESALMAAEGFTADAGAIVGPRGYGRAFYGDGFAAEKLTEPRESLFVLQPGPAFKFYPSQYGTHFVIVAALAARQHVGPAQIKRVRIISPPMPYVERPQPESGLAGKFSLHYTAALALLDGAVGVASFDDQRRFAPDMVELLKRIEVLPDAMREGRFDRMRVDIEVELEDGSICRGHCDGPPGIWGSPVDRVAILGKAHDCLRQVWASRTVDVQLAMAENFSSLDHTNVLALLELLNSDDSTNTYRQ